MNIFYLDKDTKKCAEYHVDKHVVKMITEYLFFILIKYGKHIIYLPYL